MDLRSTCNWMLLVLTLCVLIPQTDCISSQCTERLLGPTVTELCHEKISTSTVTFSCRSHPGVKMVLKNGHVVESSEIHINVTGNCLRLCPAGCSVLVVGYEKETIDCTSLDTSYNKSKTDAEHVTSANSNKGHAIGLSNTPSTVTPTTNLPEGDGNKPFLILIISCSGLLCAGFLLGYVFREDLKRWLRCIIGNIHPLQKEVKNGEYDQAPDGNNENRDDLEMQSSV